MKNWVNKMLGVKTHEPPPLSATDDYVIVNRQDLDKLIGELNNHYKPTWVGLTDEEIDALADLHGTVNWAVMSYAPFTRAIEAKLKEKNT